MTLFELREHIERAIPVWAYATGLCLFGLTLIIYHFFNRPDE